MSPLLRAALENLTGIINLSTGILHPSDESAAKLYFKALHEDGELLDGAEITNWATNNGWSQKHAKELGKLAQHIGNGGRVVIKRKNLLKPNVVARLKEQLKK
jgi:hypothetical protein